MTSKLRQENELQHLCKPCDGCGQLPVNNVAPQSRQTRWQCPHYAARDRQNITSECWGMANGTVDGMKAVTLWNMGQDQYREVMGMVKRDKNKSKE